MNRRETMCGLHAGSDDPEQVAHILDMMAALAASLSARGIAVNIYTTDVTDDDCIDCPPDPDGR